MLRVKTLASLESIPVVGEVILLLRKIGQENFITVGHSNSVVLISVGRFAGSLHHFLGPIFIAGPGVPQRGHFHVRAHVHVMGFHGMHGVCAAVGNHSRQLAHF